MKKVKVTDMIKEIIIKDSISPIMMIYPYKNKSNKHLMYVKWIDCGFRGISIVHKLTKTKIYSSDKKVCKIKDCGICGYNNVVCFFDENKKIIPNYEFSLKYPGLPDYNDKYLL